LTFYRRVSMTAEMPEATDENQPSIYEHGPKPLERTSNYDPTFLKTLQVNGQVFPVSEDWDGDDSAFPKKVAWVIYPNGDLQRIKATTT